MEETEFQDYSRISEFKNCQIIEIQTNSFKRFLTEGITQMFNDISPIKDHSEI